MLSHSEGGANCNIKKEVYSQDKVWEDIIQTDKLSKHYLILCLIHLSIFMPNMPGPNGVTEKSMPYRRDLPPPPAMIPNLYRHPAYNRLPNTLLVHHYYLHKNIKNIFCYILCTYKVNGGGSVVVKIPRPGGHSFQIIAQAKILIPRSRLYIAGQRFNLKLLKGRCLVSS